MQFKGFELACLPAPTALKLVICPTEDSGMIVFMMKLMEACVDAFFSRSIVQK